MIENTVYIIDELVERAKTGDRTAFSRIVNMMLNKVTALTLKMTGDRDAALDLAQDTFVSAWSNLEGFKGESKFESWIYRIAVNKSLNYIKSEKRKVADYSFENMTDSNTPEIELKRKELKKLVLNFMSGLPTEQRSVFELRFYKQQTFNEISETTGKALGTVKTLYREAVKKLKTVSEAEGWHK